VAEKPTFRNALKARRCLIPTSGFYEWKAEGGKKIPYLVRRKDAGLFAFAGLWERWQPPEGEPVESCTVITTAADAVMQPLHDRMPVILPPDSFTPWLDASTAKEDALPLLQRAATAELEILLADPSRVARGSA